MILGLPALPLAVHNSGYRRDDDHALDDVLVIDVDAEKGESTRHDAKDHHADDSAPNAANSAGEARAANNSRSDRIELIAQAHTRLTGRRAGRSNDTTEPRKQTRDRVHDDWMAPHIRQKLCASRSRLIAPLL
jgi:hypothetical protein